MCNLHFSLIISYIKVELNYYLFIFFEIVRNTYMINIYASTLATQIQSPMYLLLGEVPTRPTRR